MFLFLGCESGINTDDPTIAWHESGKLYVVNCLSSGRRCFKVYSFPAVLLYEIVDCPGLQSPVTWRSARNMIFSPMTLGDDNFIVVYENNGLKRHIFVLEVNVSFIFFNSFKLFHFCSTLYIYNFVIILLDQSNNFKVVFVWWCVSSTSKRFG